ncbi:nucleotide-diphospho-sugar transferase [Penicillium verhagenii]|uniref:nucleotide-diphospho-sugar transferase n=1 Tax=Penicillium verhagenii TaxID=1562060 RepID=UPI002545B262|nr:nucleotide-diphospho-sugar transferase [Penicillium verhagenii]KAJ5930539.1 nucleotide-diphospho-sugar transferase [Penicillium verhagenii]
MIRLKGFAITDYSRKGLVSLGGIIIFLWVITTIHFGGISSTLSKAHLEFNQNPKTPKYAYATIITGEGDPEYPDVEEPYLWATRLLTFQLLHNPRTRGNSSDIPLLVLVTPEIPQSHRDILTNDGATVLPVESLQREWIHPKWGRWSDVLAKLNLWRLEEYDKIAFLDADSVVFRPIDGIFNLSSTDILPSTNGTNETVIANLPPDTARKMPHEYMLAGIHDLWVEQYNEPPPEELFYESNNYLNAGFFVLHPSISVYDYYVALLDTPNQFSSAYPEQNLLNFAHRTDGPMPWKELGHGWNSKFGRETDYNNGLRTIHQKWWRASYERFLDDRVTESLQEMRDYIAAKNGTI